MTAADRPRPRRHRLKDGRLSGVLTRRLLDGAVRHPGQLIPMERLAGYVWGLTRPKTWRASLPHLVQQLNARLGATVLVRVGTRNSVAGFRLDPKALPRESVTRRTSKPATRWFWTASEDAILFENVPGLTLQELTSRVNAVHGRRRSVHAVEGRIYVLGLSKKGAPSYSANRLGPILGVNGDRVTRWIERGFLRARRSEPWRNPPLTRRPGWWIIAPADVELFIRSYPWEVDWRGMQPGHALTQLAMTVQRRDPYLTIAEAARWIGCTESALHQRILRGLVPEHVRVTPHEPHANPERATIRIPLSAIADQPARLPKGPRPAIDLRQEQIS